MLAYVPAQDPLNRGTLVALVVVWTSILLTLGWAARMVVASPNMSQSSATFQTSLARIAKWVEQTGTATVMRAPVAAALGFGNADLPVRERGFRAKGEQLTHVCSIIAVPGHDDVIILALLNEDSGDAAVWRANRSGNLISSARFANGEARRISNEESQAIFISEKGYLLAQMRDRLLRASPQPSPRATSSRPTQAPVQATEAPASERLRRTPLSSELDVLFLNPWVLPGIALALILGVYRGARPR